jgi:hypothetical protein
MSTYPPPLWRSILSKLLAYLLLFSAIIIILVTCSHE